MEDVMVEFFENTVVVPFDKFLFDFEKPFTDFGQYGFDVLDLRVFQQNIWWVNVNGTPFLIKEMSPEYLSNVLSYLVERVDGYYVGTMKYYAICLLGVKLGAKAGFSMPNNVEEFEVLLKAEIKNIKGQTPLEWLESTPLWVALKNALGM